MPDLDLLPKVHLFHYHLQGRARRVTDPPPDLRARHFELSACGPWRGMGGRYRPGECPDQGPRVQFAPEGYGWVMEIFDELVAPSTDEQLGSPGLTLESGWVAGTLIGLAVIVLVGGRRRRRVRSRVGVPS